MGTQYKVEKDQESGLFYVTFRELPDGEWIADNELHTTLQGAVIRLDELAFGLTHDEATDLYYKELYTYGRGDE